jgi:hypothetical protein
MEYQRLKWEKQSKDSLNLYHGREFGHTTSLGNKMSRLGSEPHFYPLLETSLLYPL